MAYNYSSLKSPRLYYYTTSYALIEMKLGSKEIEEGSKHLLKLKSLIKEHNMLTPSFMMVLTGGKLAYQRKDGVYVVPIGCLKD